MPSTVNGIGTGYWGKKNRHSYQGQCRGCNRQTTLTCYDTTYCFVVFFLPVIPLGKKRILDYCAACSRHYPMPFSEWQVATNRARSSAEAYRNAPTNPQLAEEAIAAPIALRDINSFLEIAPEVEKNFASDAKVLCLVAAAYDFFNRLPDAERVLRTAITVKDDDEISELLADNLMRQNRPDEAETFVQHVIEKGIPDRVDSLYRLAQAFQRKGNHAKALEYFQHSETVFPQVAQNKTFTRLKDESTRRLGTNTVVDSGKMLQRERTVAGWRKFGKIAAVVVVLAAIGYLVLSLFQGRYRELYVANGLDHPYTIRLNGADHLIRSRDITRIRVPEGNLKLQVVDAPFPVPEETIPIQTSFWTRPFNGSVFVINPDRSAILARTRYFYSADKINNPSAGTPPQSHYLIGQTLHRIEGVDYVFENPPDQLSVDSSNKEVEKVALTLQQTDHQFSPAMMVYAMSKSVGPETVIEVAKRRLLFEPQRADFLTLLARIMPRQDYIAFLRTGLDKRPVKVQWHRAYQTAMESPEQEMQVEKEYEALLAKEPDNKDLMYLAGRASRDTDKALALCTKAAAGDAPCAYSLHLLGGYYLEMADFPQALNYTQRAAQLLPGEHDVRHYYEMALLASGQYPRLMELIREDEGGPLPQGLSAFSEEVLLDNLMNKRQDVEGVITRLRQKLRGWDPAELDLQSAQLNAIDNYCAGSPAFYATVLKQAGDADDTFVANLAIGALAPAEAELAKIKPPSAHAHLLIYLAAMSKSQTDMAKKHLSTAIDLLAKGDYEDRAYAAALKNSGAMPVKDLLRLRQMPTQKLVLLTALGLNNPAVRNECFALARKLDFDRRFPHLLIKSLLDNPPQ